MNYTVPKHLFKFNIDSMEDTESEDEEDLVDSEDDIEDVAEDRERLSPKRRRSENCLSPGLAVLGSVSLSPRSSDHTEQTHLRPTSTSPLA